MLTKRTKALAIKKTQRHDADTGSPEVQIGVLNKKIAELSRHLKKNRNDVHSRRGLLGMIADRRRHLSYLKRKNPAVYEKMVQTIK